jgi:hypothetical protein
LNSRLCHHALPLKHIPGGYPQADEDDQRRNY